MPDKIDKIGSSMVHHGKSSNRVYVMSLDYNDLPITIQKLDCLATENGYTKIVVKVPICYKDIFESCGYQIEAVIPKFYNGENDGCFICKYSDDSRKTDPLNDECKEILELALQKGSEPYSATVKDGFICRQATEHDITEIADVYDKVFRSYPFPINNSSYLLNTMRENVIYFGIWDNNKLVALSSIELYTKYSHAEMTDFAVLNEYRGKGYAQHLLQIMENKLLSLQIKTAFTIARAKSAGMNIVFAKNGYSFAGKLTNNTDIAGQIESMNIWYKDLQ